MNKSETTDEDIWKLAKKLNSPINNKRYKDLLNESAPSTGGYIINLADSKDWGTHWTALWIEYLVIVHTLIVLEFLHL